MERTKGNKDFGRILKQRRVLIPLTLRKLATVSGISSSHLGRIERGERFPSASVLQRIAKPLGFEEGELFSLAGYLSPRSVRLEEENPDYIGIGGQLDPYVNRILSVKPIEVQHAVVGILSILKLIAKAYEGELR